MEQEFNFQQTIIEFNQDSRVIELRDRYSAKSFLEIMSVERSENRHSSFLAWLLGAKDFAVNPKDHPIVHLLDILIRRMGEQEKEDGQNQFRVLKNLKDTILARDITDIKVDINTEKTIKDVTTDKKYETIRDRLDLYIEVNLITQTNTLEKFEIIIENKVGSTEGLPKTKEEKADWKEEYAQMYQTDRYYNACQTPSRIFVFLTPISDAELDDFEDINDANKKSRNDNFININYQDILDEIIEPLLVNNNLSDRIHVLLEEYALSLALPGKCIEDDKKKAKDIVKYEIIMAVRKRDTKCISDILTNNKYRELIINSLEQTTSKDEDKKASLLYKFGLTYKKLFTAMLKTYIENYDYSNGSEDIDELIGIYQKSLGNANPRDLSKFSIKDDTTEKQLLKPIGKGKFAEFAIRSYIRYWENHSNKLKDPMEYFQLASSFNALYEAESLEEVQEKRYFEEKEGKFFISTQWGIVENKKGSFDYLFEKIFTKEFQKDLKSGKTYSTKDKNFQLRAPWNEIFKNCTITIEKIRH